MPKRFKEYLLELCAVYTIASVAGAIVNMIAGTETNNLNVIVMFLTCSVATFVLFMHKLFDNVSPLLMIIVQYLTACALCAVILLIVGWLEKPVSPKGWFEYYRSFTIPYVIFAAFYYYRVFSEARREEKLIKEIQDLENEE